MKIIFFLLRALLYTNLFSEEIFNIELLEQTTACVVLISLSSQFTTEINTFSNIFDFQQT